MTMKTKKFIFGLRQSCIYNGISSNISVEKLKPIAAFRISVSVFKLKDDCPKTSVCRLKQNLNNSTNYTNISFLLLYFVLEKKRQ